MLENYEINEHGIIKQNNIHKIKYSLEYFTPYFNFDKKNLELPYLRLGYILGCLKFKPNNILDIGYGTGAFLKVCSLAGIDSYGFDISEIPSPDYITKVDDIFNNSYDVITFYDSLEHMDDIYFLSKLKTKYIVISLPSCNYTNDDWFKNWKHRKYNEHLWHFNKESLLKFMYSQNYSCIDISNVEDTIRIDKNNNPNIITGVFKKKEL